MTTLALTQTHNLQSITWAGAGALGAVLRTLFLLAIGACAMALLFAGVVAAVAIVAACWVAIVKVAGCLALIALFGWATYPRSKAVTHV